ncbi:short-chain Z-isoprenyl diphosphate synthase [Actinoplanes campanulatus]|uniref:Isoprenyl transferase n=1 Tax=Actinoplanes campanulatus TaxID=113559 RepID=A0A7W5ANK4_9ACTN|nr:polyprenyl diphosphate synthase [Actinoplanes campanulatus]MBB3099435.1 short-chain Z-isoprenyl diphosphate synthase [Actinoplanes campanulatus]GGN42872.1 isoprenyl transferase [Actinoplanes campanulatus]GID39783.1 isoprenyl transferase [Actinoplanes campanulatus]
MLTSLRNVAYALYTRRLRAQLDPANLPWHLAMVMDGNRRWARQMGFDDPRIGHRYGAEHLDEVLGWCAETGIRHVTVFVASVDNVRKRDAGEVGNLMLMIEQVVAERLARPASPWRVHLAGRLDVLPDTTRHALKLAEAATQDSDAEFHLNIAIGYDGREEIVNAFRSLLEEESRAGYGIDDIAQRLTADRISAHLYTGGQPDPDLVIRTSGERRLSGFLVWQAAYSELHFCDVYWPGFRKVDFLRALRSYAARNRRFGA